MSEMVERVARAIADGLGDRLDDAFNNKREWNAARGEKGGRLRDINEPMRDDYLAAARAAIEAMRKPTDRMVAHGAGYTDFYLPEAIGSGVDDYKREIGIAWVAMIDAALTPAPQGSASSQEEPAPGQDHARRSGSHPLGRCPG